MGDHYQSLYNDYRWEVPKHFNITEVCCTQWTADPRRVALVIDTEHGEAKRVTYADIQQQANRLSNALTALGIKRGDRVAVILGQTMETVVSHMALFQMGVVSVPLTTQFGEDALRYRLGHAEVVAAIADADTVPYLCAIRTQQAGLKHIIRVGTTTQATNKGVSTPNVYDWEAYLADFPFRYEYVETRADEAAVLIYTSGTTGDPKGALIPHSAMIGNLPGFVASQNWYPKEGDIFWSPADWAWTGGLWDVLLPVMYFGMPLIVGDAKINGRFSALQAYKIMARNGVTNTFLFPTALKRLMQADSNPQKKHALKLRAIMSAGEPVGSTVGAWVQQAFGVTLNEMYGQTEANYVIGNSSQHWAIKPGSMGRPYPGHKVAILDERGRPVQQGQTGEIAISKRDIHGHVDPILFLGYWKNPESTRKKFAKEWCKTGDLAFEDSDGYFWYQGRTDDVFKSAGYRIGPHEIEQCLQHHPAVYQAAVIPQPDTERGNIIKACVVLQKGLVGSETLTLELQQWVEQKLAGYQVPRLVDYLPNLPMTSSGKIQRNKLRNMVAED
jgi:acetyl-CoA synthetase